MITVEHLVVLDLKLLRGEVPAPSSDKLKSPCPPAPMTQFSLHHAGR